MATCISDGFARNFKPQSQLSSEPQPEHRAFVCPERGSGSIQEGPGLQIYSRYNLLLSRHAPQAEACVACSVILSGQADIADFLLSL